MGLVIVNLLVQLGDIVTDMRGKSGGTVYSRGRYGLQKRTKIKPRTVYSTFAQNVKAAFASASAAWRSLTDGQRAGWRSAASSYPVSSVFGATNTLTGSALFVRLNSVLDAIGVAQITTAPAPVAVPLAQVGAVAADVSSTAFTIAYTPDPVPANMALQVWVTAQKGPGETANQNEYYLLQVADAAAASPVNAYAAYIARFGALVAGNKIFVRTNLASKLTGQVGIPTMSECTITA